MFGKCLGCRRLNGLFEPAASGVVSSGLGGGGGRQSSAFQRGSRKCSLGVFAVLSKLMPRELGFWVKLIFFVWLIFEKGSKCVILAVAVAN